MEAGNVQGETVFGICEGVGTQERCWRTRHWCGLGFTQEETINWNIENFSYPYTRILYVEKMLWMCFCLFCVCTVWLRTDFTVRPPIIQSLKALDFLSHFLSSNSIRNLKSEELPDFSLSSMLFVFHTSAVITQTHG